VRVEGLGKLKKATTTSVFEVPYLVPYSIIIIIIIIIISITKISKVTGRLTIR
jgi:hypothetical protein